MIKEFILSIGEDGSGLGWTKIIKLDGGVEKFKELLNLSEEEKELLDEMDFGGEFFYVEDNEENYKECTVFQQFDMKKGWYEPTLEEKYISVQEAVDYCKQMIKERMSLTEE